jgi:hypothetical protein
MTGECRRCRQIRTLCRSHIIPEWAYRPLYDPHHRATALSSEGGYAKTVQTGLWERLFCEDCERFFNHFDERFFKFWSAADRFPRVLEGAFVKITGIDYATTKRFLLSVLWRAHVSRRPELAAVQLGPHAEKIERILNSADTTPSEVEYPVFGFVLRDSTTGAVSKQMVLTPARTRTDGRWNFETAFLGCVWKTFVASQTPTLPASCTLKTNGTVILPILAPSQLPAIRRVWK